jgi:hypothetical protein
MRDGRPRSWRHYVYGMAYLARAKARRDMQLADAFGIAQAEKEDRKKWFGHRDALQRRG